MTDVYARFMGVVKQHGYFVLGVLGVICLLTMFTFGPIKSSTMVVKPLVEASVSVAKSVGKAAEDTAKTAGNVVTDIKDKLTGNGVTPSTKDAIAELRVQFARLEILVRDKNLSTKAKVDEYHLLRARIEILLLRLEDAKVKIPDDMVVHVARYRIARQ